MVCMGGCGTCALYVGDVGVRCDATCSFPFLILILVSIVTHMAITRFYISIISKDQVIKSKFRRKYKDLRGQAQKMREEWENLEI